MINSRICLEEVIGLAELTEGLFCGILPAAVDLPADYEEAGTAVWAIAIVVAVLDYASWKMRGKMV